MLVSIILPLFTYRMGDRHPCRAVRGMVKWRHNRIQKGRGIEDGFYKKDAAGLAYQETCAALRRVIGNEARRFGCLLKSELLDAGDKDMYRALTDIKDGRFTMADEILVDSLRTLSQLLAKHYGKKVILLLDEYDVPLDKAFQGGYYAEMVSLLRNMLGGALKTNPNLYFAVLTGCLRVAKESIFTGLNNMKVFSITDSDCDSYFGFTDGEVRELLSYYGLDDKYEVIKNWYDGYQFGDADVYCPWDVINYVDRLRGKKRWLRKIIGLTPAGTMRFAISSIKWETGCSKAR